MINCPNRKSSCRAVAEMSQSATPLTDSCTNDFATWQHVLTKLADEAKIREGKDTLGLACPLVLLPDGFASLSFK
jgi:hypothetical protein